jgi:hypothetical protein
VPEFDCPFEILLTVPRNPARRGFRRGRHPQMMATSSSRTVQIDSFALDAIEKLAV